MEYAVLFLPLLGAIFGYLSKFIGDITSQFLTTFFVSLLISDNGRRVFQLHNPNNDAAYLTGQGLDSKNKYLLKLFYSPTNCFIKGRKMSHLKSSKLRS